MATSRLKISRIPLEYMNALCKVEIVDNGLFNSMQIFPRVLCNHDPLTFQMAAKYATHTMLGVLKMLFDINTYSCVSGLVCVHLRSRTFPRALH